ncbi:MAG TPA: hypothetical protein PK617_02400 [Candidatus Cloacimonas sp.]|nr:hypothetical protein [Candidatus Cloacimonas sp.]
MTRQQVFRQSLFSNVINQDKQKMGWQIPICQKCRRPLMGWQIPIC